MRTTILLVLVPLLLPACGEDTPSAPVGTAPADGGYRVFLQSADPDSIDPETLRRLGVTRAIPGREEPAPTAVSAGGEPRVFTFFEGEGDVEERRWLGPERMSGVAEILSTGGGERAGRYTLWRQFALGQRGAVIRREEEFLAGGEPTECARRYAPVLRELSALGELVVPSVPRHDGIAVLCGDPDGSEFDARIAAFRLFEDVGVEYRVLRASELEAGALSTGQVRVLWMPAVSTLPGASAEAVRSFVEDGGVVMADHEGAEGEGAGLDSLFGITRGEAATRDFRHRGMPVASGSVRLAGGVPEDRFGDVPVVVRCRHGRGFAVYLNLDVTGYRDARLTPAGGRQLRDLVAGYLSEAGVQPGVAILAGNGGPIDRILRVTYTDSADPDATVLFVMRNLDVRDGMDPLMEDPEGNVARVRVLFREPVRVTNLRTGEDLGIQPMVEDHLMPLEALVYRLEQP